VKQATLLFDFISKYAPTVEGFDRFQKLEKHYQELQQWGTVFNLIGAKEQTDIFEALYLDSLISAQFLFLSVGGEIKTIHDVGSGAGFPGLMFPLFFDNHTYTTLHEHRRKKSSFLKTASREMGLTNVTVSMDRVVAGAFLSDVVTSRATFSFQEWLKLGKTLVRGGGFVAAYLACSDKKEKATVPEGLVEHARLRYTLPVSKRSRETVIYRRMV